MSERENESFQTPESQLQRLRDLVTLLSAALLRSTARNAPGRPAADNDPLLLLAEADECFRRARMPGLKPEIAEGLETAGHEFMAKAVEIETARQRQKWKK
jgi:hypothetical protein